MQSERQVNDECTIAVSIKLGAINSCELKSDPEYFKMQGISQIPRRLLVLRRKRNLGKGNINFQKAK
ncbi:hypothetical protein HAX54_018758, partial [Datura stramonium]|nr:hypothetical protein [Datura stramonium]